MSKDTETPLPAIQKPSKPEVKKPEQKLVVRESYMYDNKGIRSIYMGGGAWLPESDDEFLDRFKYGIRIDLCDLKRACQLHPLLLQYAKAGMDYETAIGGICLDAPFKELFHQTGFHRWGTFREMTCNLCPGLKALFDLATQAREAYQLEEAEKALKTRAIKGVKEPVFTPSGKLAGHRIRYSDKLLEMHLKALDPAKYSEKHQHEVKGMVLSVNLGLRD